MLCGGRAPGNPRHPPQPTSSPKRLKGTGEITGFSILGNTSESPNPKPESPNHPILPIRSGKPQSALLPLISAR